MNDRTLLEIRGLTKRYPGVLAVDDVHIRLSPGEVVGFVGKNGAGKSTVIKMLAGVAQPDAGAILLDGQPIAPRDPHHANTLGMAFVFQELAVAPNLTVAENVELGLGFPRRAGALVDWRALHERTRAVLARLNTTLDPTALVSSLSVAEQRLVMIARALAQRARLLVLDEPTASLTDSEIQQLYAVVRCLRNEGVAILYVSHRLDEIFALTSRVIVMRDGRVVATAPTATLSRAELIAHITGVAGGQVRTRRTPSITAMPEILRVDRLTAPDRLTDVSFTLRAGEILGLAGLVGAGRSELVRALFGAEGRVHGSISVRGQQRRITSPRDALAAGIVLLPEDRRAQGNVLNFSVRANITLASLPLHRRAHWLPMPLRQQEEEAAQALVKRLAVRTPHLEQTVGLLSGGNQQKVMLAKWLRHGAEVFLFDEPTHGIDVEAKEAVYRVMEELAAEGKGVIFISSEFSELVGVCQRALVLREGRLVADLTGSELSEAALIQACYTDEN
jgi:ABC-type sugar transport system ATPase subunit